ncbi:MAG: hypothetical protein AAGG48_06775 [Planctomycetota bacterium]
MLASHLALFYSTLIFLLFAFMDTAAAQTQPIAIRESIYQDRDHFVVETSNATYWLDQKSGGLSKLVDREGIDWIQFRMKPWGKYPASASGAFRGLPNLLFGDQHAESGFGHPGWDRASSRQVDATTIESTSESGHWQLRWSFSASDVRLSVKTSLPDARYWFLYEGPIAGRWSPNNQYFASDTSKPSKALYDYTAGERNVGRWRWAYFGDRSKQRVLFVLHEQSDQHDDTF